MRRPLAITRVALGTHVLVGVEVGAWDAPYCEEGWIDVLARVVEVLDLGDLPSAIEANAAASSSTAHSGRTQPQTVNCST
jgi:hypothetical protein